MTNELSEDEKAKRLTKFWESSLGKTIAEVGRSVGIDATLDSYEVVQSKLKRLGMAIEGAINHE